jgi:RecG-like helicase
MKEMNLSTSLEQVKGVGPKTAEQLRDAGLLTVGDLMMFLPRRHDDFTGVTPIAELKPGKVTIKARCESISTRPVRRGLRLTTAVLADESGKLYYVRSRSGALHYNEVMGELLGNTFAEAVQGLVKQLVLLRDESVMSMTPEFKEAINKLEEKYLK